MTDAPLHAAVADGPEGGRAFWLTTADSVRIRAGLWNPKAPQGTVLLLPGRTEYVEKYGRAARELATRGYATLTLDWRGQGLADRPFKDRMTGHVGDFSEFQSDLDTLVEAGTDFLAVSHAVWGGDEVAAIEAAAHGVRVNSVHPSPVNTRMMRSLEAGFAPDDAEGAKAAMEKAIPLGRYGDADDIASLVLFLASVECAFITGGQYRIDGGRGAM